MTNPGPPAQPSAYPGQPPAYPAQSGGYPPAYPAQPAAYPPAYPAQPAGYPPAYPAQPAGYPPPTYSGQAPTYPAAYPAQPTGWPAGPPAGHQPWPAGTPRPPQAGECRVCGSTPAAKVTFHGHRGLILLMRFLTAPGPYCRDCGLATFRKMTADTLVLGWWGAASFFITPITVLINVIKRGRVAKLGEPRKYPEVVAPLPAPLNPGKPLVARPQFWVAAVIIVGLAGAFALGALNSDPTLRSVGGCTRGGNFVSCDSPHDGKIIDITASQSDCPSGTDTVVIENRSVYCLVDD